MHINVNTRVTHRITGDTGTVLEFIPATQHTRRLALHEDFCSRTRYVDMVKVGWDSDNNTELSGRDTLSWVTDVAVNRVRTGDGRFQHPTR